MKTQTRRNVLKMITALPATAIAWPQWMPRLAFAPQRLCPPR